MVGQVPDIVEIESWANQLADVCTNCADGTTVGENGEILYCLRFKSLYFATLQWLLDLYDYDDGLTN